MLGVFSSSVVSPPEELVAAGSRTPSPKTKAAELVSRFLAGANAAISVNVGDYGQLAFTHDGESPLRPSGKISGAIRGAISGEIDSLGLCAN